MNNLTLYYVLNVFNVVAPFLLMSSTTAVVLICFFKKSRFITYLTYYSILAPICWSLLFIITFKLAFLLPAILSLLIVSLKLTKEKVE